MMMDECWLKTLQHVLTDGDLVEPRGKKTREFLHHTVRVDMRYPVLTHPDRRLSYQFMAAEAFWILNGDDSVAGIAPYNKRIAEFSDDGIKFFGAYGPKIKDQFGYVMRALSDDRDTRQAGLTIWRECPPKTKDVPCTIAIFANIRKRQLNLSVFMRSSDMWLGLPYDIFNFSMLGHLFCCAWNETHAADDRVTPGIVFLTAASMHLYAVNTAAALNVSRDYVARPTPTPDKLWQSETVLMETLMVLRDTEKGSTLRWWEQERPS
jgi:thymidylate synthase